MVALGRCDDYDFQSVGTILGAVCNGESVGSGRLGANDFRSLLYLLTMCNFFQYSFFF